MGYGNIAVDAVPELIEALKKRSVKVFLTGYAHIDSEWLWDLEETSKVCSLTFRRILELMRQFNNIVFVQGAVLNYELVERLEPELFEEILVKVKEGNWRIVGAPFLEFDAYMPSGESLVRHLLYGRQYFKKYGVRIEPVLFLPDSFGFPLSLPRILRGFGIKFFVTYKLNWNDTSRIRYHMFYWGEGPEEAVLTYILPGGYNDYLSDLKRVLWILYKQFTRQKIPVILVVYGRGDHGGGPEEVEARNIERWRRRLSRFMELAHSGMEEFFEYIEKRYGGKLPLVKDELYLEFHRGAYTTGATVKKLNRINENLVSQIEKLYTMLKAIYAIEFPFNEVKDIWKSILLGQGHDSLPATVTHEVYTEIIERGYKTFRQLLDMLKRGLEYLSRITGYKYVIFNPNAWRTSTYIRTHARIDGHHQVLSDGTRLYYLENLPPLGYKAFNSIWSKPRDRVSVRDEDNRYVLENKYLRVTISKRNGWITSVFDKVNKREVLKDPIRLRILWDIPAPFRVSAAPASIFDAWEVYYNEWINRYLYKDLKAHSHGVLENGPLYASVKLSYRYRQITSGTTLIDLEVGLYADKPYLEIVSKVYWRARHRLLKLLIPLRISTQEALFEVPYGVAARRDACLSRGLVDRARFEVPGHRWVDISSDGYGVAVITDSRYGYSWCNGVLGVSLLRAATPPNKDLIMRFVEGMKDVQEKFIDVSMELSSGLRRKGIGLAVWLSAMTLELLKLRELKPVDRGYHAATVYVYPHRGSYAESGVVKYAAELNTQYILHASPGNGAGKNAREFSLLSIEPSSIVEVTALKPCEHGDCYLIRMFNASSSRINARLKLGLELSEVYEADLAENPLRKLEHDRFHLSLELKPHEIKTLLVRFHQPS